MLGYCILYFQDEPIPAILLLPGVGGIFVWGLPYFVTASQVHILPGYPRQVSQDPLIASIASEKMLWFQLSRVPGKILAKPLATTVSASNLSLPNHLQLLQLLIPDQQRKQAPTQYIISSLVVSVEACYLLAFVSLSTLVARNLAGNVPPSPLQETGAASVGN